MHDNRPFIIQGEENYRRFLEAGKEHNSTKALERFNKHHKKKEKNMERLTYRDELGISIDKNEDCPTCSICWNCDIPPRKCNYLNDALEKLAEYEDAEEQGLLLRLPCKVGDTVWDIDYGKPCAYTITGYSFGIAEDYIDEPVKEDEIVYYYTNSIGSIVGSFSSSEIGKTVFLTKEAAEQALADMKGGEE